MLTSIDAIAGLWLAAWPLWIGGLAPAAPLPAPKAVTAEAAPIASVPSHLLDLTDDELLRVVESNPAALGSLTIGSPGSAILVHPVALPVGPLWEIAPRAESWGTVETIDAIHAAVETVHELFPDTPPIVIGDISDEDGGRLKRHESHQGGRDVDFGFYFKGGNGPWFARGTAANLDLSRNWALVRAFVTRTDVETVFLDSRIQRLLYQHALKIGEDREWLDRVFQCVRWSREAVVRHIPGHRNHYHVRFYNPVAQELGRRAHPFLVQFGVVEPPVYTVRHVVRRGQTIGHLAARFGTSIRAIQQANGLTTTRLRAGRAYRIPVRAAAPCTQPIVVPPRLLPQTTPAAMASVAWPTPESLYGDRPELPTPRPPSPIQ